MKNITYEDKIKKACTNLSIKPDDIIQNISNQKNKYHIDLILNKIKEYEGFVLDLDDHFELALNKLIQAAELEKNVENRSVVRSSLGDQSTFSRGSLQENNLNFQQNQVNSSSTYKIDPQKQSGNYTQSPSRSQSLQNQTQNQIWTPELSQKSNSGFFETVESRKQSLVDNQNDHLNCVQSLENKIEELNKQISVFQNLLVEKNEEIKGREQEIIDQGRTIIDQTNNWISPDNKKRYEDALINLKEHLENQKLENNLLIAKYNALKSNKQIQDNEKQQIIEKNTKLTQENEKIEKQLKVLQDETKKDIEKITLTAREIISQNLQEIESLKMTLLNEHNKKLIELERQKTELALEREGLLNKKKEYEGLIFDPISNPALSQSIILNNQLTEEQKKLLEEQIKNLNNRISELDVENQQLNQQINLLKTLQSNQEQNQQLSGQEPRLTAKKVGVGVGLAGFAGLTKEGEFIHRWDKQLPLSGPKPATPSFAKGKYFQQFFNIV